MIKIRTPFHAKSDKTTDPNNTESFKSTVPSWRFPFTKTKALGHRTPNSLDNACGHAQSCLTL